MERKVVAVLRPTAGAGTTRVVRDDGGVRLEGDDLVPDGARVDDVPGRHEQNRPLAVAISVPGDLRPVARSSPCRAPMGVVRGSRDDDSRERVVACNAKRDTGRHHLRPRLN